MKLSKNIKQLASTAMLAAIIFILAFTPFGFIQLPFIKATIIHIPVIIGSIILGPKCGGFLGFSFGLTSLINNTMAPAASSFAFSPFIPLPQAESGSPLALVVCFLPRILVGVIPYFAYKGFAKLSDGKWKPINLAICGVIGSLTNTLLVMHLIFVFFKDSYAEVRGVAADAVYSIILGIIAANGIPEAIVAGIITVAVCAAVLRSQTADGNI